MTKYLLIILLLTGCGVEEEEHGPLANLPGWTGDYVEKTDRFTVNYNVDVIDGPLMEMIETEWLNVQTCMGIAMPDPGLIIEYTPKSEIPDGYNGYYTTPRYIRVRDTDPGENRILRHEFVHYILWWLGDIDKDHESPYFDSCVWSI